MKLLCFQIGIILVFAFGCKNANNSDSSDKLNKMDSNINGTFINSNKDNNLNIPLDGTANDTNSGFYKGIYFFDDAGGATQQMNIDLIILINDTCSYLYFGSVLERDFSIKEDMISFGNKEYPNSIYVGEGRIEDDGVTGEVILKTGQSVNGMVRKVSGITDSEMNILFDALKQEQEFFAFWSKFNGALDNDNAELLAQYLNYPFEDFYGKSYPNKESPYTYDAKDRNDFIKNYSKMFKDHVKYSLKKDIPHKQYNEETYYMFVEDFRPLRFDKIRGSWKLTCFPYLE